VDVTAPATPDAERWQGWGTALKPAHEPIVLARKPLEGTVAGTVLAHGTGALNVDGCRIEGQVPTTVQGGQRSSGGLMNATGGERGTEFTPNGAGRWPANAIFDEEAAAMLDAQTGELGGGRFPGERPNMRGGRYGNAADMETGPLRDMGDSGGASRFYYCAKASTRERNAGLDAFDERTTSYMSTHNGNPDRGETWHPIDERTGQPRDRFAAVKRNHHPTVKPISLMRWLVRLVSPPGGLVLDPFCGSGTTGIACVLEGFEFVGVEREAEYAAIARARLAWWEQHPEGLELIEALAADRERRQVADTGQLDMFAGLDDG
jgi:hypothetical protein